MLDAEALWEICLLERKVMNINLGPDNIDIKVVNIQLFTCRLVQKYFLPHNQALYCSQQLPLRWNKNQMRSLRFSSSIMIVSQLTAEL